MLSWSTPLKANSVEYPLPVTTCGNTRTLPEDTTRSGSAGTLDNNRPDLLRKTVMAIGRSEVM